MWETEEKRDALNNVNELLAAFVVFMLLMAAAQVLGYHFERAYDHILLMTLVLQGIFVVGIVIYIIKRIISGILPLFSRR